jgi:hypothetical protein
VAQKHKAKLSEQIYVKVYKLTNKLEVSGSLFSVLHAAGHRPFPGRPTRLQKERKKSINVKTDPDRELFGIVGS